MKKKQSVRFQLYRIYLKMVREKTMIATLKLYHCVKEKKVGNNND